MTRILITLFAWVAAHLVVMALFMLFGSRLGSQPLVLRVLVAVGALVIVMAHVARSPRTRGIR